MEIPTEKYIFPIIAIHQETKKKRFLGTGFFLDKKGTIATCAHVLQSVNNGEKICLQYLLNNKCYPLNNITHHSEIDLSIAHVAGINNNEFLTPYPHKIMPGFDVCAYGFNLVKSETILIRFQKGHIVSIYKNYANIPQCNTIIETSFPSIAGFSGTPIWSMEYKQFYGMLHRNYESSIETYSSTETSDEGEVFKESICRITELGIAHPVSEIVEFYDSF